MVEKERTVVTHRGSYHGTGNLEATGAFGANGEAAEGMKL